MTAAGLRYLSKNANARTVGPLGVSAFESVTRARYRFQFGSHTRRDQPLRNPHRLLVGDIRIIRAVD